MSLARSTGCAARATSACSFRNALKRDDDDGERGELQEAALAAEAIPREADLLLEELQKTQRAEGFWRKELEQVQELRGVLENSVARCQEEAASEAAESLRLRKCLEDRGCGLSWLRSIARSHVEDLQGSVTSLDLHLQPALQAASLGSNDG
eukprot:s678_g16.t1